MLTFMTIALTPEQEERLRTLQAEGVQPTQFVDAALDLLERNKPASPNSTPSFKLALMTVKQDVLRRILQQTYLSDTSI